MHTPKKKRWFCLCKAQGQDQSVSIAASCIISCSKLEEYHGNLKKQNTTKKEIQVETEILKSCIAMRTDNFIKFKKPYKIVTEFQNFWGSWITGETFATLYVITGMYQTTWVQVC